MSARTVARHSMEGLPEEQLIEALQCRLHTTGPLPKREIVIAGLAISRDPSLQKSKACDDAGVARGSRARAAEFGDRITREGLVAACVPPPPPELPPPIDWPQHHRDQLNERHPHLQPPSCPQCSTSFELTTIFNRGSWCDKCKADLPKCNVYWTSVCSCHNGGFDLCHSCIDPAAQLDWSSMPGKTSRFRGSPPFERDADYWEKLRVSNDFYVVDESSKQGSEQSSKQILEVVELESAELEAELEAKLETAIEAELETARALGLPYHKPGPSFILGVGTVDDDYISQLLVSEKWIASNAPNIWWLNVSKLVVSEDGKHATRELSARMKIVSQEDREKEEEDELSDEYEYADVVYDFPPAEPSTEIFAHQRRIERMRQREMTAIRELDGQAAVDHRERKAQMERVRSEKRERCI